MESEFCSRSFNDGSPPVCLVELSSSKVLPDFISEDSVSDRSLANCDFVGDASDHNCVVYDSKITVTAALPSIDKITVDHSFSALNSSIEYPRSVNGDSEQMFGESSNMDLDSDINMIGIKDQGKFGDDISLNSEVEQSGACSQLTKMSSVNQHFDDNRIKKSSVDVKSHVKLINEKHGDLENDADYDVDDCPLTVDLQHGLDQHMSTYLTSIGYNITTPTLSQNSVNELCVGSGKLNALSTPDPSPIPVEPKILGDCDITSITNDVSVQNCLLPHIATATVAPIRLTPSKTEQFSRDFVRSVKCTTTTTDQINCIPIDVNSQMHMYASSVVSLTSTSGMVTVSNTNFVNTSIGGSSLVPVNVSMTASQVPNMLGMRSCSNISQSVFPLIPVGSNSSTSNVPLLPPFSSQAAVHLMPFMASGASSFPVSVPGGFSNMSGTNQAIQIANASLGTAPPLQLFSMTPMPQFMGAPGIVIHPQCPLPPNNFHLSQNPTQLTNNTAGCPNPPATFNFLHPPPQQPFSNPNVFAQTDQHHTMSDFLIDTQHHLGMSHSFMATPNSIGLMGSCPIYPQFVQPGPGPSIPYRPSLAGGTNLVNATAPQMATSMVSVGSSCLGNVAGAVSFQTGNISIPTNTNGPSNFVIQTANGQLLSTGFNPSNGPLFQPQQFPPMPNGLSAPSDLSNFNTVNANLISADHLNGPSNPSLVLPDNPSVFGSDSKITSVPSSITSSGFGPTLMASSSTYNSTLANHTNFVSLADSSSGLVNHVSSDNAVEVKSSTALPPISSKTRSVDSSRNSVLTSRRRRIFNQSGTNPITHLNLMADATSTPVKVSTTLSIPKSSGHQSSWPDINSSKNESTGDKSKIRCSNQSENTNLSEVNNNLAESATTNLDIVPQKGPNKNGTVQTNVAQAASDIISHSSRSSLSNDKGERTFTPVIPILSMEVDKQSINHVHKVLPVADQFAECRDEPKSDIDGANDANGAGEFSIPKTIGDKCTSKLQKENTDTDVIMQPIRLHCETKTNSKTLFKCPPPPVHYGPDNRRIITHYIDGHVIYESNKPFPVFNSLAVVESTFFNQTTNKTTSPSEKTEFRQSSTYVEYGCAESRTQNKTTHLSVSKKLIVVEDCSPEFQASSKASLKIVNATKQPESHIATSGRESSVTPMEVAFTHQCSTVSNTVVSHLIDQDQIMDTCSYQLKNEEADEYMCASQHSDNQSSNHLYDGQSSSSKTHTEPQSQADQSHRQNTAVLPLPKGDIRKWTPDDVVAFVNGTPGCGAYASAFLSNEIDGEALLLLAEDQFIQPPIGMKIGPALKLAARLESIKHKQ